LDPLAKLCWSFLRRTGHASAEGFCPEAQHVVVAIVLHDILPRLPPSKLSAAPEHQVFPGETGIVSLGENEVQVPVQSNELVSTGLWLPAGVTSHVTLVDDDAHPFAVRIGSHAESLLLENGPWKRWPSVVTTHQLTKEGDIGSPFGGMLYLFFPRPQFSLSLQDRFTNCCKYPRWLCNDLQVWEDTKDIQVPWGEVDSGPIIFTLPSDVIRRIDDFSFLAEFYTRVCDSLSRFLAYSPVRAHRLVFDMEAPGGGAQYSYPLLRLMDSIDEIIFGIKRPSVRLFEAVSLIGLGSMREGSLDIDTETAIATVAAALTFRKLFPDFDPLHFNGLALPQLFSEFWTITLDFPDLISRMMPKFQDPNHEVVGRPEDMWVAFVEEMSKAAKYNFRKFLERTRPVPLNIATSLQGLPVYDPSTAPLQSGRGVL
jgi:hypothetical protein